MAALVSLERPSTRETGRTVRLVQGAGGLIRALEPAGLDFRAIQREFSGRQETWLELIEWVDACPERFGFAESIDYHGLSLWSFARMGLVDTLGRGVPDLQAVVEALRRNRANRLEVSDADRYWARVFQAALSSDRIVGSVRRRRRSVAALGEIAGRGFAHAARFSLALARAMHHRFPRMPDVLALGYSTTRRVNGPAGTRYIDPSFTPILDELRARGVSHARLSIPTIRPGFTADTSDIHADKETVPIELAWGLWWAGPGGLRARREVRELRNQLQAVAAVARKASVPWGGVDVGPLAGALVAEFLLHRVPQGLGRIRFFEHLLGTIRPRSLLLTSEYSGAALAATMAARRIAVPVVAVQHGVIWPGHPGYVAGGGAYRWLARPDVVCVYGNYDERLLRECGGFGPEQVVMTGAPRFDLVAGRVGYADLRRGLIETLILPPEAPLVLFTSPGPLSGPVAQRLIELLTRSSQPISLIVKLHPIAEEEPEAYAATAREAGYEPFRVVREEFDLYDLLRAVDVHASTNSTVLTEACVFGVPNLMVCGDLFADTVGYIKRGVAIAAEPYGSLQVAVHAVLHGPEAGHLSAGRDAFVADQFFGLDGHASDRIVDVILGMAARSAGSVAS